MAGNMSPLMLQTLGKDIFIALSQPVTHKFLRAGARAGKGGTGSVGTVVPRV